MGYDEKTRTITIGATDTEEDLTKNMLDHMAHVEREIRRRYPRESNVAEGFNASSKRKSRSISKPIKAAIVFTAAWTVFVIVRTMGSFELLGIDFDHWQDRYFLANWLVPPFCIFSIVFGVRWVMREVPAATPVKAEATRSPLSDFQRELKNWGSQDAAAAMQLMNALLIGDNAAIDRHAKAMTPEQMRKVLDVVKHLRGDK